jgi:hypothetical protein
MDLKERGWGGMDWTNLAQDRAQWKILIKKVMNLWVPQNVEKLLGSRGTGGFSIGTKFNGVGYFVSYADFCS